MSKDKSRINFTERQKQAIRHEGSDLVVAASAGAGKTAVLIDYIFRKIALPDREGKTSISQILAMTFTEAAAQSMKKRLFQRMNSELSEEEKQEGYDSEHLRKEAKLLPSADICTIDSFCAGILNQYCYVLGWDPKRPKTVLDSNTVLKLKKEAAHETVMNGLSSGKEGLFDFVSSYSDNGNHIGVFESILIEAADRIDQFNNEEEWFETVNRYYENTSFDLLDETNRKQFYFSAIKNIRNVIRPLSDYIRIIEKDESMSAETEKLKAVIDNISNIKDRLEKHEPEAFDLFEHITLITSAKLFPKPTKKTEDLSDREREHLENYEYNRSIYEPYYKDAKKAIEQLQDYAVLYHSFAIQNSNLKPRIALLLELIADYRRCIDEKKAAVNGIDFVDMEKAAIRILENREIADRLRKKYKYILVDEYQDSNDIQEKLVQLICRKEPGNVFRVGDVKQSIYGFRGAKAQLMRNMIAGAKNEEKIVFEDNFRSSKIIVKFNNLLYSRIMNIDGYSDSYTKENDIAKAGSKEQTKATEKVELHLLDLKDEEGKAKKVGESRADESYYVAEKIVKMREDSIRKKKLLEKEWMDLSEKERQQYFYDNGIYADWKDYVVLVRNHSFKRILEKAFDDYGIPKFFITNKGYYDDIAVQTVISWLKWIFDSDDEIAMFSVLSSPYYSWNNEMMADFALEYRKLKDTGTDRCAYLFERFPEIREDHRYLKEVCEKEGVIPLIGRIMNLHDFYYEKTTGEQRDNLALFFEKCASVEELYPDLTSLIEWLKINQSADEGSATSISETADVVRIITIHNSKGLEYPVVFYLADSLKARRAQSVPVRIDEDLGMALNVYNMPYQIHFTPLIWKNIDDRHYQEDIEEEIRLMYVATTRAMSKLVIVAFEGKETAVSFDASTIEYLAPKTTAVGDMIKTVAENDDRMKDLCDVWHMTNEDIHIISRKTKDSTAEDYSMPKLEKTEAGYEESSPSALEERNIYRISYEEKQDAALRGTLIHKAFEQIDFKDPKIEDIEVPLSMQDKEKIMNFFSHDLADRIRNMKIYHELPYALMEDGMYMHGFMDLVAMDDSQIILVDYKSDIGKSRQEYLDAYSDQQNAYRRALKRFGLPISCYLYAIEPDELIEVEE